MTNNNNQQGGSRNSADEAALEFTKQLITLASGALVLSATFIDKIGEINLLLLLLLGLSWIVLLASVVAGLETISAIVKSRLDNDDEWSQGYGKNCAKTSKYGFFIGIALFIVFAFISLSLKTNQVNIPVAQSKTIISDSLNHSAAISDSLKEQSIKSDSLKTK